ncbi:MULTISPECIES: hypothetical protein [unclassified Variovorax]|uniref:hypothetical protein n=1 Tax=unclassified Variovorax TaxID=663243 RepID=UPI00076CD0FD|nr:MULTISPECIES: hypothetical protein [unclassified Variovorax]KWT98271.1 hypothetical protein APY03_0406 [Variovorax sp. WDL1]PNG50075.1 hypothetical protein CHC06_05661 [Variovorax sp. B2]PNG50947.1 hypothetical protein CHC07_05566 [Variovorax sp. B4]VTU41698.1 hypothetical protein SRS16P1_00074 [Variovorax sp. SRS16]VTU41738.1 hypothetical protein E5P1_00074 [Variovorax sp. PBL-E5]
MTTATLTPAELEHAKNVFCELTPDPAIQAHVKESDYATFALKLRDPKVAAGVDRTLSIIRLLTSWTPATAQDYDSVVRLHRAIDCGWCSARLAARKTGMTIHALQQLFVTNGLPAPFEL